jgi:hypothetical protein
MHIYSRAGACENHSLIPRKFRSPLLLDVSVLQIVGAGAAILLYVIVLHSLAGIVTGSLFKTRTLLCVLTLVLAETAIVSAAGVQVAVAWILTNLVAIQLGYVAGIFARWAAEQAGYSIPPARIRWPQ